MSESGVRPTAGSEGRGAGESRRYYHPTLAAGRWKGLSLVEQMANIGSEVHRTVKWKRKDNEAYWRKAFERARELIDLTIDDEKNRHGLREIVRVREALADHFVFDNEYHTTDENWLRYFDAFTRAARVGKRAQANCSGSGSEQ